MILIMHRYFLRVMNLRQKVIEALEEGKSVAIKYQDVRDYLDLKTGHRVIFLEHINPAKETAAEILADLGNLAKSTIYSKYTTNEIVRDIKKRSKNRNVLLVFNDFQLLSKNTARVLLDLMEDVQVLCSIRGRPQKGQGRLLKRMTILSDRSDEVTDIKIPLIVFASFIAILTFVKAGSAIYNRNHFDFYLFSAAIFVGISVGRTLLWIS